MAKGISYCKGTSMGITEVETLGYAEQLGWIEWIDAKCWRLTKKGKEYMDGQKTNEETKRIPRCESRWSKKEKE